MNEARRKSILDAACKDRELVGQVPAVVAAGFGVLALRRLGDVLTVACFPRANRQALRLLRDVLEVEIVATPFEDHLLHEAIKEAYFPGEETVNFPTFLQGDFLEERQNASVLVDEKVEDPGPCTRELAPDSIVLATLSYRAMLKNLDAPDLGQALPNLDRTRLDLGDLDTGWSVSASGQPHAHLPGEGLRDDSIAVLTQYRLSEYRHMHGGGQVSEHHVRTQVVGDLPVVVHPTEVQLTGVAADGTLIFHVYDHHDRFTPGGSGEIDLSYYFLSYGNRMLRQIQIALNDLLVVPRSEVQVHAGKAPWGATELQRWFGLPDPPIEQDGN